jgi:hypothetical protein
LSPDRRSLLKWTSALARQALVWSGNCHAQPQRQTEAASGQQEVGDLRKGMFSFMLASERFSTAELVRLGVDASRAGFHVPSTSDGTG